jgi:hypothetical protein
VVGSGTRSRRSSNDAIRENACHTWHAEEDIAESQVHLLLACRYTTAEVSGSPVEVEGGPRRRR